MANTHTALHYHVVFSTKRREPWIRKEDEARLWAYLGGIAKQSDMIPLCIGGVEDHVHMLLGIPATIAVSDALKRIKGGSSPWVKETLSGCAGFSWQDGYGAFTVSKSLLPEVENYIRHQREHHRAVSSQDEYRAFLDKHGVRYDERYLWD